MEKINDVLFLSMLMWAGWQDFKQRSIDLYGCVILGCAGLVLSVGLGKTLEQIVWSCSIGIALLAVSRVTDQAIGEGDGCFFLVSGLYLTWRENLLLFLGGLGISFLISLSWIAYGTVMRRRIRKQLPFLSFLIIPGVWIFLSRQVLR